MLAHPAMDVVFVLVEVIRLGRVKPDGGSFIAKGNYAYRPESVTVTECLWKRRQWNAINPASEKPKFGRGIGGCELKQKPDATHR